MKPMTDSTGKSNLEQDLAAAMAGETHPAERKPFDFGKGNAADQPHFERNAASEGEALALAERRTSTFGLGSGGLIKNRTITPAALRSDNDATLNLITDERKSITGEIAGIDQQMNALLDKRNKHIERLGELAQSEAMIRAAQTVGNAPRWSQG